VQAVDTELRAAVADALAQVTDDILAPAGQPQEPQPGSWQAVIGKHLART
jgi:hypothetical protein